MIIHLLFEQSGTFKNIFKKLGFEAYDYDLENNFNETDYIIDLFIEIENCSNGKKTIFDNIKKDDLIIAFFPCTYFSIQNNLWFSGKAYQMRNMNDNQKEKIINDRYKKRNYYLSVLDKFVNIIKERKIKTIIENPYHDNYLKTLKRYSNPNIVIKNRRIYGDYFIKPTMFYFYNLEPTYFSNYIINFKKEHKTVLKANGIERSLISKDFAFNFINKYILGLDRK